MLTYSSAESFVSYRISSCPSTARRNAIRAGHPFLVRKRGRPQPAAGCRALRISLPSGCSLSLGKGLCRERGSAEAGFRLPTLSRKSGNPCTKQCGQKPASRIGLNQETTPGARRRRMARARATGAGTGSHPATRPRRCPARLWQSCHSRGVRAWWFQGSAHVRQSSRTSPRGHAAHAVAQGSTISTPISSKSRTLRVATAIPRHRAIAAIWQSAGAMGRPAERRPAAISA